MEKSLSLTLVRSASVLGDGRFSLLAVASYLDDLTALIVNAQVNNRTDTMSILKADWIFLDSQTGMHLADASVWISVAMSLAVFNVSKIVENGVEITPEIDPSSGTIR